ncbi:hypothetical protein MG293_013959 [Ovis ammon polii]|uniref:Uncharacterized protein n=1 Tax=Ovis ammon polii TaxID=230172 RepID=A0AAD4Y5X4_OVIAM|nr:hypothetical protein MG293_013959 [Ovis ammon polii]
MFLWVDVCSNPVCRWSSRRDRSEPGVEHTVKAFFPFKGASLPQSMAGDRISYPVTWHWKNLTELDQLWMLKCLRFNWYINISPTPYEQGVWKKHYIQMVKELHVSKPKFLFSSPECPETKLNEANECFSAIQETEGATKPEIVDKESDTDITERAPQEQINHDHLSSVDGTHKNNRSDMMSALGLGIEEDIESPWDSELLIFDQEDNSVLNTTT